MTIVLTLGLCAILPAAGLAADKSGSESWNSDLRAFVRQGMEEWNVPGVAIAIVDGGEVVFAEGFGYRDLARKLEVTPDTIFTIASMSKAFTATSVGILVDEGKLGWEDPVRSVLPIFRLQDPIATDHATPIDLLSHRTGLPRHDMLLYGNQISREELIRRLQYLQPSAAFRSIYQYNSLMFIVAGHLIDQLTGQSWERFVKSRIFKPLGMTRSYAQYEEAGAEEDRARLYLVEDGETSLAPNHYSGLEGPAGSIQSTARDMARWLLLNLNEGAIGDQRVISEASLSRIHSPHAFEERGLSQLEEFTWSAYGLGWGIETYRGHPVIAHGGSTFGFRGRCSFLPRSEAGFVILTNADGGEGLFVRLLEFRIVEYLLGLEPVDWLGRVRTAQAEQGGGDSGDEKGGPEQEKHPADTTRPPRPLRDYAGRYENSGYGLVAIEAGGGELLLRYNDWSRVLQHVKEEHFMTTDLYDQEMEVWFQKDEEHGAESLGIGLEPAVDPIVFRRVIVSPSQ